MTIDRFDSAKPCRVLVFTNPKAGSGASREQVPRLMKLLGESAVDCIVVTAVSELTQQLVASSTTHQLIVVAAGGDGTLSLAASTIASALGDQPAVVLPMPLGTENLLARNFQYSAGAESVLHTIRHGDVYEMDCGIANGRPFLIMATCGFDAEVVRAVDLKRQGHIWRLSYLRPILRGLRRYGFPRIVVRIDNCPPIECGWAMVFNLPRYGGGLKIMPKAVGNDGLLDVIAFQKGSFLTGMKYVAGIWLGRHLKFRDVIHQQGRVIEIASDKRVPFQLDGDYAGRLPIKITLNAGSVRLLLPARR